MAEPTRDQFARRVISLVRKRFPLVKIARASEPFAMKLNGRTSSLENLYRIALLRPDEVERHVNRWAIEMIRAAEGTPDEEAPFKSVSERVMPIVIAAEADELLSQGLAAQQIVEGLSVSYVIDGDRTIAHILLPQLDKWKIEIEELHEQAMQNLIDTSDELGAQVSTDEAGETGFILFQSEDGYDSSRLLLPELHNKLRSHLGSPFLAAVPTRDLLVCFRDRAATIAGLMPQVQDDYRTRPNQVTDRVFMITPDGIANWNK